MKKIMNLIGIILIMFALVITTSIHAENYKTGTKVSYNNMDFYVISDKGDYLTLLKSTPLTVDEVNKYGVGYVNKNTHVSVGEAYNVKGYGYGSVAYYSSETCGYLNGSSGSSVTTGCTTSYDESDIKHIVDEWSKAKLNDSDLQEVQIENSKYKTRLITLDELQNNLGYVSTRFSYASGANTPSWVYRYGYWTMTPSDRDNKYVFRMVTRNAESADAMTLGRLNDYTSVYVPYGSSSGIGGEYDSSATTVRPVIHLKKSANFTKTNGSNKKSINDTEFKVGDVVEYNNAEYYVVKNSLKSDNTLTMVKMIPLSYEELKLIEFENNTLLQGTTYSENAEVFHPGYVRYLSNNTCNSQEQWSNCNTDYDSSSVKPIVDAWASRNLNESDLREDGLGYKVRLLTIEEINQNFGYVGRGPASTSKITATEYYQMSEDTVVNLQNCWTMSGVGDSDNYVYALDSNGNVNATYVNSTHGICPVITITKAVAVENKEENIKVSVPDTLLKNPIFIVIIGIILISSAVIIINLIMRKKKRKKQH